MDAYEVLEKERARLRKASRDRRVNVAVVAAGAAVDIYVAVAARRHARDVRSAKDERRTLTTFAESERPARRSCKAAADRCAKRLVDDDAMKDYELDPLRDNAFASLAHAFMSVGPDKPDAAYWAMSRLLESMELVATRKFRVTSKIMTDKALVQLLRPDRKAGRSAHRTKVA